MSERAGRDRGPHPGRGGVAGGRGAAVLLAAGSPGGPLRARHHRRPARRTRRSSRPRPSRASSGARSRSCPTTARSTASWATRRPSGSRRTRTHFAATIRSFAPPDGRSVPGRPAQAHRAREPGAADGVAGVRPRPTPRPSRSRRSASSTASPRTRRSRAGSWPSESSEAGCRRATSLVTDRPTGRAHRPPASHHFDRLSWRRARLVLVVRDVVEEHQSRAHRILEVDDVEAGRRLVQPVPVAAGDRSPSRLERTRRSVALCETTSTCSPRMRRRRSRE